MWNPFGRNDSPSFIERPGGGIMGAFGGALAGRLLFHARDNHRRDTSPPVVLQPQPQVEPLGPFEVPVIPNNRTPFAQLHAEYRRGVDEDLAEQDRKAREGRLRTMSNVWNPNQRQQPLQGYVSSGRLYNDVLTEETPMGGLMPYAPNAFVQTDDVAARSRQQLADFQKARALKQQEDEQYARDPQQWEETMSRFPVPPQVSQPTYPHLRPDQRAALRTPNVQVHLGEQATSYNTNKPPKPIDFSSDVSLMVQLWHNYVYGNGQPIIINMADLDLDDNIDFKKFLQSKNALKLLKQPKILKRPLEKALGKPLDVYGNEKVTHIFYKHPKHVKEPIDISEMKLHFEVGSPEWAAFGQLAVDMSDVHIMVHHDKGNLIEVSADLKPAKEENELDTFDFNPDADRPWYAEALTHTVHYTLPGTSFKIYGRGTGEFHDQF